jgi:hypothetical protein
MYKTPQEAIQACEEECERTWGDFIKSKNLDPEKIPEPVKAAYRVGYLAGARFVTGVIVSKLAGNF